MLKLPKHKCGLYLTHNAYKDYHQSAMEGVAEIDNQELNAWISAEERIACLKTGEIWDLQWYPDTPIGFIRVVGSTLEAVLLEAQHIEEKYAANHRQ